MLWEFLRRELLSAPLLCWEVLSLNPGVALLDKVWLDILVLQSLCVPLCLLLSLDPAFLPFLFLPLFTRSGCTPSIGPKTNPLRSRGKT